MKISEVLKASEILGIGLLAGGILMDGCGGMV
jgi:hypothetical protein